jgi:catechol 2,3-dioxygenase-like lactoylglutathione lyase family enzyme
MPSMIKTLCFSHAHYECRSLGQTLPVFTDLLAADVVERKPGEAIVKHPNTDVLLVVHEGGLEAPDKPHGNHYGFRVADHKDIDRAFEYLEAHKEKYGIKNVTPPAGSHFAYSVYFEEPGGNTLEIEYYNPGGAIHGRSVAAGHWQGLLTEDRFPGRGYIPQALSHGTMACDDQDASRRFYTEVLGLEIVGGGQRSMYIGNAGAPWYVVVQPGRERTYLRPVNRYTLKVASPDDVVDARRVLATSNSGVTELGDIEEQDGKTSFIFSDLDKNWWEVAAGV